METKYLVMNKKLLHLLATKEELATIKKLKDKMAEIEGHKAYNVTELSYR